MVDDVDNTSTLGVEWRREASTMAFYVAVCLIAALVALDDDRRLATVGIVWGTTIGLALAHLFAFRLAARLVGGGRIDTHEASLVVAQLTGAVVVAVIATIPVLIFPAPTDADATRLVLSGFIGLAAFATGRSYGAGTAKSAIFAGSVLLSATAIALVKNFLLGH